MGQTITSLISLGYQHKELRTHLRVIISEIQKTSKKEVLTGGARTPYMEDVFEMIKVSYKAIGIPLKDPNILLTKYPIWWLYFNKEGKPVSFSVFKKTKYGLKSGLGGFDGSPEGKRFIVDTLRTKFNTNGVYGEVSHKVKGIVLASGAPQIPVEYVSEILGKEINPTGEFTYERSITGVGVVEKVMVGKPKFAFDKTSQQIWAGNNDNDDIEDRHAHAFCTAFEDLG